MLHVKKLLEDIEMLQINFILIYIIHKISVLIKITRIIKCFLRSVIDFCFFKKIIFLATYNDEKFKKKI